MWNLLSISRLINIWCNKTSSLPLSDLSSFYTDVSHEKFFSCLWTSYLLFWLQLFDWLWTNHVFIDFVLSPSLTQTGSLWLTLNQILYLLLTEQLLTTTWTLKITLILTLIDPGHRLWYKLLYWLRPEIFYWLWPKLLVDSDLSSKE
jgi:hypothetical protein